MKTALPSIPPIIAIIKLKTLLFLAAGSLSSSGDAGFCSSISNAQPSQQTKWLRPSEIFFILFPENASPQRLQT